ncbi:MAG: hypothetical protein AB1Z67_01155 [Candidatus Limnocylindrales bacterium]
MEIETAELVFWAVVLSRLLVPLLIPRFPLPAIVACLVIDAVDQTVFQAVAPDADLSGYQSYDKALDIYYLVIAYTATLRNWTNQFAVSIARFLIFWRLVGVVFFELGVPLPAGLEDLLGERGWLFIFPNVFEYFFIFYESVRVLWDPRRMSRQVLLGAAAFIWIFIKLPQEWWIHIAQLDTTDFVQEDIFGVPAGTAWVDTFAERPWIVVIAVVVVVALLYAAWWIVKNKLPPRDRPLTIDADAEAGREVPPERLAAERKRMLATFIRPGLFEKLALIALTTTIFGQMLGVSGEPIVFATVIGIIVVGNAVLSTLLERQGFGPGPALRQFIVTGLLNFAVVAGLYVVFDLLGNPIEGQNTFFFVFLITLLVTLYDRYRPEYVARFSKRGDDEVPAAG